MLARVGVFGMHGLVDGDVEAFTGGEGGVYVEYAWGTAGDLCIAVYLLVTLDDVAEATEGVCPYASFSHVLASW